MYLIVLAKRMLINANYFLCDTKVKIIYRVFFLVKSNCRWSIKKYFWNAAWRSWRFPNFPNDSNMYKIIQLSFYDRHKTEYKSLAMKLRSWIKGFLFYQIRKVYPPRKIAFFNARAICFYSLVPGWCSVQKTVTVFSEKYLKFFTINVLCTQVHSQLFDVLPKFLIALRQKFAAIRGSLFVVDTNSQINFLLNPSIHSRMTKPNLFTYNFHQYGTHQMGHLFHMFFFLLFSSYALIHLQDQYRRVSFSHVPSRYLLRTLKIWFLSFFGSQYALKWFL